MRVDVTTETMGGIERRLRSRYAEIGDTHLLIALAMIFKLAEAAERSWRRLDGHNQFPKIVLGARFPDGIKVVRSQAHAAAA